MIVFGNNVKLTDQQRNLYNISVLWILGREWILATNSSDADIARKRDWDLSCQEVIKSILTGATGPTPSQQAAMQWSLGDRGFQYLLTVYDAFSKVGEQYPPGFNEIVGAIDWKTFACFARWVAEAFVVTDGSTDPGKLEWYQSILNGRWSNYNCPKWVLDDPMYSPIPVTPTTTTTPPGGNPPIPTGINPTTTTPPKPDLQTPGPTWWGKWKTTIGVGTVGLAAIGGIMYFGRSKPARKGK